MKRMGVAIFILILLVLLLTYQNHVLSVMNDAKVTENTECWENVKTLSDNQEDIDKKILKMKQSFYDVLAGNGCSRTLSNGSLVWTCPKGAVFVESVIMTKQR